MCKCGQVEVDEFGKDQHSFIKDHAQELLESHTTSLLNFDLNDLAKVWPMFVDAQKKSQISVFLCWAKAHWKVEDLPECIMCIRSMSSSLQTSPKEIEGELPPTVPCSTKEYLQYFLNFCVMAVVEDFEAQCKHKGFIQLDSGNLIPILQNEKLNISNENVVLDSIIAWVQGGNGGQMYLPLLLECIRIPFVDISYVIKIPTIYPQIGHTDEFKALLREALQHQVGSLSANKRPLEEVETDRKRRRTSEIYQLPAPDAAEFASFVAAAVVQPPSSGEGKSKSV